MQLFRFPGGKTKINKILLDKIEDLFGNCSNYAEPFFGGGSIGLKFLEDFSPQKSNLVKKVVYDPKKHGDNIEAEPGDRIWFWEKENKI